MNQRQLVLNLKRQQSWKTYYQNQRGCTRVTIKKDTDVGERGAGHVYLQETSEGNVRLLVDGMIVGRLDGGARKFIVYKEWLEDRELTLEVCNG